MIIFAFDLHNHNPLMGQHPAETSASTFLMLVLNLPNAVTTLTQLMLWWPSPIILFRCYFITAILLLLWIIINIWYAGYPICNPQVENLCCTQMWLLHVTQQAKTACVAFFALAWHSWLFKTVWVLPPDFFSFGFLLTNLSLKKGRAIYHMSEIRPSFKVKLNQT